MNLELRSLWSPDLTPPSPGAPNDLEDFHVLIQVELGQRGEQGSEVFSYGVISPSQLQRLPAGSFLQGMLLIERFDWGEIRLRIENLLDHARSLNDWEQVIRSFAGMLVYSDDAVEQPHP